MVPEVRTCGTLQATGRTMCDGATAGLWEGMRWPIAFHVDFAAGWRIYYRKDKSPPGERGKRPWHWGCKERKDGVTIWRQQCEQSAEYLAPSSRARAHYMMTGVLMISVCLFVFVFVFLLDAFNLIFFTLKKMKHR